MQYVSGLRKLGYDVAFVEDSGDYPACYDPERSVTDADPTYGLRFAADAFAGLGLGDCWAYYDAPTNRWRGPRADSILDWCASADLLIDLCDAEPLRPWLEQIPSRALIDTDPAFSQVRHLTTETAYAAARRHTAFFSFGENVESGDSVVPDDGFPWRATRQPIDLEHWPLTPGDSLARWTTVMQWDSYRPMEYGGVRYDMKAASFEPYVTLPKRVEASLELALGSPSAPRALLAEEGWHLLDSRVPSRTPWTYRRYLQRSKGEFSVAKHGYVVSRSGWFSERSACYLASGRPVVTQDTGFSRWLETGAGLMAFETPDQAVACLEEIDRDYERHCRKARELVAEHFDARRVLAGLVESALSTQVPEQSSA